MCGLCVRVRVGVWCAYDCLVGLCVVDVCVVVYALLCAHVVGALCVDVFIVCVCVCMWL